MPSVGSVRQLGNFQAGALARGARARFAIAESVPSSVLGEMGAARPVQGMWPGNKGRYLVLNYYITSLTTTRVCVSRARTLLCIPRTYPLSQQGRRCYDSISTPVLNIESRHGPETARKLFVFVSRLSWNSWVDDDDDDDDDEYDYEA